GVTEALIVRDRERVANADVAREGRGLRKGRADIPEGVRCEIDRQLVGPDEGDRPGHLAAVPGRGSGYLQSLYRQRDELQLEGLHAVVRPVGREGQVAGV